MKKVLFIMIVSMGVLSSCTESRTKYVIARNISGDTTTLHRVRVDREFKVGEVVFPINKLNKMKIVRECR